jgi:hypothetical protein
VSPLVSVALPSNSAPAKPANNPMLAPSKPLDCAIRLVLDASNAIALSLHILFIYFPYLLCLIKLSIFYNELKMIDTLIFNEKAC